MSEPSAGSWFAIGSMRKDNMRGSRAPHVWQRQLALVRGSLGSEKRRAHWDVQVDVFAFAIIMLETFSRIITSTIVTGPTYNPRAAELYAVKVRKGLLS